MEKQPFKDYINLPIVAARCLYAYDSLVVVSPGNQKIEMAAKAKRAYTR
jgi:hypothetical protein